MNILKLIAQLTLDGTRFKSGLREAEVASARFSKNVGRDFKTNLVGAFGVAALTAYAKKVVDYGSAIHDASKRTQQHTDALQEEVYWAEQNGASLSDLTAAYKGLGKARLEALEGDEDKMAAFESFGINRAQLEAQTLSQTFRQIAEFVRTNDLGADEGALLERVIGRGGGALVAAFSESLTDSADEARRLGIVLDENVVNGLDNMGDSIDKIIAALRGPMTAALFHVVKTVDLLLVSGQIGLAGLASGAIGIAQQIVRVVGKITPGGTSALDAKLQEYSQILGIAVDDTWNSFLDRYDTSKTPGKTSRASATRSEVTPAAKGDSQSVRKRIKELEDTISDAEKLNRGRPEINSLVSSGQFGGRNFVANADRSSEINVMKQQLAVMKEQLEKLRDIATKSKGKTLIVNP